LRQFFERLAAAGKASRPDLVEKDFWLHCLLHGISKDDYLAGKIVFKGGTCLIKAYLGYYRFSEDADFTWKDAGIWKGRSKNETARACSAEIDNVLVALKRISAQQGLSFRGDKRDMTEVNMGSGGRMVRFFLRYNSEVTGNPSTIKVELNFEELILHRPRKRRLRSFIESFETEELRFLFRDDCDRYGASISMTCYDPREIFAEKCRAYLTRLATKLRDPLDICFLQERYGYQIKDNEREILAKTRFILDLYSRYRNNLYRLRHSSPPLVSGGEELKLLLAPGPPGLNARLLAVQEELHAVALRI
jgi:predicted nucleotidyltransferase component of viral defense system